jgi:hypothetical protein
MKQNIVYNEWHENHLLLHSSELSSSIFVSVACFMSWTNLTLPSYGWCGGGGLIKLLKKI